MTKKQKELTVIIATYNRAEVLKETLTSMSQLVFSDINAEIVIVDNNSNDQTKEVVKSFQDQLPLRYLFEPKPGKNCALNKAIAEIELGSIIVFADDDIAPRPNWLQVILASTRRWPEQDVFGGKIEPIFPEGMKLPAWVHDDLIIDFGFVRHDWGDKEKLYDQPIVPLGPNYWMRKSVLAAGSKYDESLGPRPKSRTMGDETGFLLSLRQQGHEMVYVPDAEVKHCIQPEAISISHIRKRAVHFGKGYARTRPLCNQALLKKYPAFWYLRRIAAATALVGEFALSILSFSSTRRVVRRIHATIWITYNLESIRMAWHRKKNTDMATKSPKIERTPPKHL